MEKKPIMLIVDDVELNRAILSQFFQDTYRIIEAENGSEAMQLVKQQEIDVILLDLIMPVMDGFEFLRIMKLDERYKDIPVIATTARSEEDNEARVMELGAADFITKPYNPTIVRCRVHNVMARLENEWRKLEQAAQSRQIAEMRHYIETDSLTGLYDREHFCKRASELMQKEPQTKFSVAYFNISCFKVVNDLFGPETGNLILRTSAAYLKLVAEEHGVAGRLEADHFAICLPSEALNVNVVLRGLDDVVRSLGIPQSIIFYAGVYQVESLFLPVDQMCDRAHMALNTIKGQYSKRSAFYDDSLREMLLEEQMILREMEYALTAGQFQIYPQAVYSLKQHKTVAAEALVRWQHPSKGMISPGRFITLFERNGFITQLDHYVWEKACCLLVRQRELLGEALPVSVNVSRLNFYTDDLISFVMGLMQKYQLDPSLLHLEITESAYSDNPEQLMKVIKHFRERGFKILMDDFGSGYSSLNMLKEVPVDVLKVDMKFVQDIDTNERAAAIVKSVVELAQNVGMQVTVEGVERKEQLEILEKMGCDYIQGYYFAHPMPEDDYLTRIMNEKKKVL